MQANTQQYHNQESQATPHSAHTGFAYIMQQPKQATSQSLTSYANAMHDIWFAKALQQYKLLAYLAFASEQHVSQSMHALLYAYRYPGTQQALHQLCLGLFGHTSLIIVEEAPAVINLGIELYNQSLFFSLASSQFALADGFSLAELSISALTHNPLRFLQQFVPAGVLINSLRISLPDAAVAPLHFTPQKLNS